MLLHKSHLSDCSVALPSLAKLTLCAAAIQAAYFSFPALAADNPVVEKTAYSDIISPDPSNPSNWVVNRGTDDPAKGPASISWRHGAATSTLTIGASSGQTVKILGGEPLAAVLYYRANGANFTNKKTGELFQVTKRNGFGFLAREGKMGSFINNGTIDASGIDEALMNASNIGGKTVGIPLSTSLVAFTYNPSVLEEAGVDLILLACSTFNYAAELGRPLVNTPIAQIDRPMMEKAVRTGKQIGLLATLATTVPSSERLLDIAAAEAGAEIERKTLLCSEAFEEYSKGNIERHNEILVDAIDKLSEDVDCIVMAQLSMSALAPFLKDTKVPVYNSGETGFLRVREMLEEM